MWWENYRLPVFRRHFSINYCATAIISFFPMIFYRRCILFLILNIYPILIIISLVTVYAVFLLGKRSYRCQRLLSDDYTPFDWNRFMQEMCGTQRHEAIIPDCKAVTVLRNFTKLLVWYKILNLLYIDNGKIYESSFILRN